MSKLLEYFKGDELAASVWQSKYAREGEETPFDMHKRLAKEFARIEEKYPITTRENLSEYGKIRKPLTEERILELFDHFNYIIPQGSVMATLGSSKISSLSNCFFNGKMEDNINSIWNITKSMAQIGKMRGGTSTDLSNLRPRGAKINNSANTSTGAVSWLNLIDSTGKLIGQEGRKMAMMVTIDVNHPDVEEFATIKNDLTKVTNANLSIKLNKEFLEAVEKDKDYILRYPTNLELDFPEILEEDNYIDAEYNKLYPVKSNNIIKGYTKKIEAKELWDTIINSAWKYAEPGLLLWHNVINYDPTSVYPELMPQGTNPCQPKWAPVLTKEGIKNIGDIKIGDLIWSNEGWTSVINKVTSGIKKVYAYRTTRGVFYGTENHKIVQNGIKIEVKDAKTIDTLKYSENFKPEIDNQDIIDGLVIGDGSVHKASNNLVYLIIGTNDQDYLESEIKNKLLRHRPGIKKGSWEIDTTVKYNELPLLPIREIPERFFKGNKNKVCGFLRGLYSANGSVVDKRVTLKTSSSKLREQVQIMLSSIGISSYYTTNKSKKVLFNNGEYECKESYDINIGPDRKKFYDLIGFIQQYKTDKLEKIIHIKNSNKKEIPNINVIDFISEEEVIDITVNNKSHTYWTGGHNVSNCSELPLGNLDSCRLILSNLYSFVDNPFEENSKFNEEKAYQIFYETQVLADNLVDLEIEAVERILTKIDPEWLNDYSKFKKSTETGPIKNENYWLVSKSEEFKLWWKIREIGSKGRRTGSGITAYGDMMAALGLPYGDPKMTKKVFTLKLKAELDASIDMAILRGAFPLWDKRNEFQDSGHDDDYYLYGKNDWYDYMPIKYPEEAIKMYKFGRRNAGISTIAPAGSVSILTQTTSGIEPLFMPYYIRRKKCNTGETPDFIDQNGVGFLEYMVIHPKFKDWILLKTPIDNPESLSNEQLQKYFEQSPWYNQTSDKLDYIKRLETQSIAQKYITSAISSTVNFPKDTPKEIISDLYFKADDLKLKGITVYVDGSRSGVLVNKTEEPKITERPDKIPCKVIRFKNEKKNWIAFVGTINNHPYEIFTGVSDVDEFPIPTYIEDGFIIKIKSEDRSRYDFQYIDNYGYTNTLGGLNRIFNKEYWNYARFVSALLREGTSIINIIKIIEKLEFSNRTLNSWQSGIIRALKSFIEDGTVSEGEKCPDCGAETIVYEGGCKICKTCGSSACG